jgi:hypothetical protein
MALASNFHLLLETKHGTMVIEEPERIDRHDGLSDGSED